MEYANLSLDAGAGILTRSLRAGSPTLTKAMLDQINDNRRRLGLTNVSIPHGCPLHRAIERRAAALEVLERCDAMDRRRVAAST
jgi:hypothetical protein